ncbi:hypothetical protein [Streptomyces sp. WAC08241]|uniref:hypothetical protein n=1 Tax=Streptomyces sp. WAC08241 TaxID=2487421 RepID=UPI000F7BA7BB|nr:hypothetical protein EF906_15345 [Streptomyces sp. WAC08241]
MRPTPTERDRLRAGAMDPRGVPHDLGATGITSSGARGTGRTGETVRRTFATAGPAPDPAIAHDPVRGAVGDPDTATGTCAPARPRNAVRRPRRRRAGDRTDLAPSTAPTSSRTR